jgi:hypothetical protein
MENSIWVDGRTNKMEKDKKLAKGSKLFPINIFIKANL